MIGSNSKLGLAGKITKAFIANKQLAILTIIAIIFWGVLSFTIMPKQYNPNITAPAFNIVTEFPGASSDEVYELITRPMENKVKEIESVDRVMSQSMDGGVSIVTVQFFIGENIEDAKISLMQKLESNMDFKPENALNPLIREINPDDVPIVVFALTSDKFSEESLRKIAWDIGDEIKHGDGISKIEVKGGKTKQLSVRMSQSKLSAYSISIEEIIESVRINNLRMVIGDLDDEGRNIKVVVDGSIKSASDIENIRIGSFDGQDILISDVAEVNYDSGDISNFVRFSDSDKTHPAVFLAVSKSKGSNATTVANKLLEKVKEIREGSVFGDVDIQVVRNDGKIASESVRKLTANLFVAIVIVSFVLFLFLGWRSALVVSLAIPLTLAVVFGVGNLFGQTINRITLFALILSLGLLVDNATVIVENIYRLLKKKKGESKEVVIPEAIDEVGSGLVMSTITTIFAFIPMAFVTGMMGPYMGPIPFFVPVALLASLLIALTITPFLLNMLMSKEEKDTKRGEDKEKKLFFVIIAEKLKAKYEKILRILIFDKRKRRIVLTIVIISFFISMLLPLLGVVKFRMLPKDDKEQVYLYLDLPGNTPVEKTDILAGHTEKFLLEYPEIVSVQSFIGESQVVDFNGLFKGSSGRNGENQATIKINLLHPKDREKTSEELVFELRAGLGEMFSRYPDMRFKLIEDPPGPPVLSTFLIKIQGEDEEVVSRITRDIEEMAFSIEEVVDIDSTLAERSIEYVFEVDKMKASEAGISAEKIASSLRMIISETNIGVFHQNENDEFMKPEQEFIVMSFGVDDRNSRADIDRIFISSNKGEKVPLSEFITEKKSAILPVIYSDDFWKTQYISAEMGERSVTYGVIDAFGELLKYKLPNGQGIVKSWSPLGVTYFDTQSGKTYRILLDGEWRLTLEVFRDLGLAMAVAIFLIYFVLVFQFKSLKIPLFIMGTIPLAMIGVMPGFAILGAAKGIFFNATSMIGVIALAGIVVNNAIILLEYIREMREDGLLIEDALIEAGRTRFLPIVLTSMTTILGSLTIVSDPVWAGLAWAIIWGLSISAFLTLIIFPLFFYIFERKNWNTKLERTSK